MKENIYNQLTFNRLTRAQYNTLASNNQINPYELYFIIDEDSYALSNNTYTKSEVDALIQGINISNYYNKSAVDNLISDFATETYVDTAVNDMATETYVDGKISDLVNGAGSALDTLKELSDALGNDANFATTVANQIALKANASTTYTKTEVDNALSAKADASTTYTKTEVDNLIPPAQTFKTINGETITGSGNITISAGSELTMNSSRPDAVTLTRVNVIKDARDAIVGVDTNPGSGIIWFENEVDSDFDEGYCVASFTVTNPNATYKLTVTNDGQSDNSVDFFFNIDTDIRDDRGLYPPEYRIVTKTATELNTTPYVYSIANLSVGTHYIYAAVLGEDDEDAGFDIVATLTQDRVELTNIEKEGIIYDITGGSNSIDPTDYYVGSLKVSASSTNNASPRFGSILPASTNTYTLGTSSYLWNGTYANTYNIGNGVNYYINGAASRLNALVLSNSLTLNNGLLKYGQHNLQLPSKSGTLATTSDIPNDYLTSSDFKTINNESIVGSGNITISGGSGSGIEYMDQLPSDTSNLTEGDIIAIPGASGTPEVISLVNLPAAGASIANCPSIRSTYTPSTSRWSSTSYTANVPSGYKAISYMITFYSTYSENSYASSLPSYLSGTFGYTTTFNVDPSNSGTYREQFTTGANSSGILYYYDIYATPTDSSISFYVNDYHYSSNNASRYVFTYVLGISAIVVPE